MSLTSHKPSYLDLIAYSDANWASSMMIIGNRLIPIVFFYNNLVS